MLEVIAFLLFLCRFASAGSGLTITAPSGTYTGIINGTAPNVRQFLKVPFALPPIGERRWLPPVKGDINSSTKHDSTNFSPSCPQYITKWPSLYGQDLPEYRDYSYNQNQTAGSFLEASSEDCLYLAIWTPAEISSRLPVIMFMTGGGYTTHGVNVRYQLPYHWVEKTQSHIVVTIK